jgi:hypothetical protein
MLNKGVLHEGITVNLRLMNDARALTVARW